MLLFDDASMREALALLELSALAAARLRVEIEEITDREIESEKALAALRAHKAERQARLGAAEERLRSAVQTAVNMGVELRRRDG